VVSSLGGPWPATVLTVALQSHSKEQLLWETGGRLGGYLGTLALTLQKHKVHELSRAWSALPQEKHPRETEAESSGQSALSGKWKLGGKRQKSFELWVHCQCSLGQDPNIHTDKPIY
jgi:hypothetical protein